LIYINPGRIDGVRTRGSGALIAYIANIHGWRDKYSNVIVSDTKATIDGKLSDIGYRNRCTVNVLQRGSNSLTTQEAESINLDSVVMAFANPAAPTTQTVVWIQNGVWKAVPFIINHTLASFLALADTYTDSILTKSFTIGYPGSTGNDYTFTSAANTTAQNIQIVGALPAFAKLTDWSLVNQAAFTGAVSLGITLGTSSTGTQISTTTDMIALNALQSGAVGGSPYLAGSASAIDVWVGATPGANWSLVTAGKLKLVLTYIDNVGA
jgi:hypothetical protein